MRNWIKRYYRYKITWEDIENRESIYYSDFGSNREILRAK